MRKTSLCLAGYAALVFLTTMMGSCRQGIIQGGEDQIGADSGDPEQDCGDCQYPKTCGGGGVPNVCGCTPETDAAFCARLGKTCGAAAGTDDCGDSRTASCGKCPAVCGDESCHASEDCTACPADCGECPTGGAVPAFPEAQGGGAVATGGRGGTVIHVTTTAATGAGSLYEALLASGPRIIVFDVSGIIDFSTITTAGGCGYDRCVRITNGDLTIAGQTSPGYGIIIKNGDIELNGDNIIIRYITIRPGFSASINGRALESTRGQRQIMDHLSISWVMDDAWFIYNYGSGSQMTDHVTMQYSLFGGGFFPKNDPWGKPGHSTAIVVGAATEDFNTFENVDIHHNLFTHYHERTPLVSNGGVAVTNNLMFDTYGPVAMFRGAGLFDFVDNIFKMNSITGQKEISGQPKFQDDAGISGTPSIFLLGNIGYNQPDPNGNQWVMMAQYSYAPGDAAPSDWQRFKPRKPATYPVITESVTNLESKLLPIVGNSRYLNAAGAWVARNDVVDAALIADYLTGTDRDPINQDSVCLTGCSNGYPTYYYTAPYMDSDKDGMPDEWETSHGFDPDNAADGNQDADNDRYTNVEEFLNGDTPE